MYDRLVRVVSDFGLEAQTLPKSEYSSADAMSEIYRRMRGCAAAVVFGFLSPVDTGIKGSENTTPWVHLEAGMAFGCNLPLLLIREAGVNSGAFDDAVRGQRTHIIDLSAMRHVNDLTVAMEPWVYDVKRMLG